MSIIIPANSAVGGGFDVANSLRFNTASSDSLTRTQSASPTSATKGTLSFWIKRSLLDVSQYYMSTFQDSNNRVQSWFQANNTFKIIQKVSASTTIEIITNRVFRDISAWYHVVLAFDTDQGTSSNRVKIYINGDQETSFSTATYPAQGQDAFLTKGTSASLGAYNGSGDYTSAYFSEIVLIDGQQLTPTSFAETNSDSGIWIPKTITGLTFGTNGYYLKFANSASLGTDSSGEGNNFTVNNLTSLDQTADSPSNNWNTWNVLQSRYFWGASETSFASDGNTTLRSGNSQYGFISGTMGIGKGKFYWETKIISETASDQFVIGIASTMPTSATNHLGGNQYDYGIYSQNGNLYTNNASSSFAAGFSPGDTISIAIDYDNAKLYFAKNGAWSTGSGSWGSSTFNAATGAQTITTPPPDPATGFYFPAWSYWDGTGYGVISSNFGNPPYAISSGNADANGFGNFEYAPPTGYFSLCTNNLNILE